MNTKEKYKTYMNNQNNCTRYAWTLGEVYEHIECIMQEIRDNTEIPYMWFRGQTRKEFLLNPSLMRATNYQYNCKLTYGENHLREEYRFQNFMSRNFDKIDGRIPQYKIEWQEVMQHYFSKTRLMDWSESLTVALMFALEDFIKPIRDLEVKERCRTEEPVIWILRPDKLNNEVYRSFASEKNVVLINNALKLYKAQSFLSKVISKELRENEQVYFSLRNKNDRNLDAMVSLSGLEILRNMYCGRELDALRTFEMNPFFFLLLRYYSDGVPVFYGKLPPLAIIHPYHSERIRSQKGVFTVFPHYIPNEQLRKMEGLQESHSAIAMEYMPQCIPYLYKIQILNPHRVAEELMFTGDKRCSIYPDMEKVSQDLENVIEE